MALITYKKAPIKVKAKEDRDYVEINTNQTHHKLTMGEVVSGIFHDLNNLIISSRIAGFFVPLILIIVGFFIIYKQVWPDIDQTIKQWGGYYDTESVSLVAGDYIERAKYLSNPGAGYFEQLSTSVSKSADLLPDPTSTDYTGTFKLSIDSLGLYNLRVTANVISSDGKYYQQALNGGLAHFKGTGLPISEVQNNIVVYGHSSSGDYYERTKDPTGAFSMLNKIKIGAIIKLEIDGKTYQYRVTKSKIVMPDDISVIIGTPGKRTLTLFTCFPNGNNAQRFIAVAVPVY